MKRLFKRIWDAITFPFVTIAILIDESRYINKYWMDKK